MLWIFGFGRSGSTWLAQMLAEHGRCGGTWNEPQLGYMLGTLGKTFGELGADLPNFILGGPAELRRDTVRGIVAAAARPRFGELRSDELLLIKEQNGSIGAGPLMEAHPRSALILLVRDPRDVMVSARDALADGSWGRAELGLPPTGEIFDLGFWAQEWCDAVTAAAAAFDAHPGPRSLVRYEDLRADTSGELRRIGRETGWELPATRIERVAERHSFERVPLAQRGPGRFHRRGEAGGWRAELEPQAARLVEGLAEPLLDRFYPGWRSDRAGA